MNFDIQKINKIFYDLISSLSHRRTYGFDISGSWEYPKYDNLFSIVLNFKPADWLCSPFPFSPYSYLEHHYSFYQIDQNHMVYLEKKDYFYFLINGEISLRENHKISLRELILFIIYMKHLSSRI